MKFDNYIGKKVNEIKNCLVFQPITALIIFYHKNFNVPPHQILNPPPLINKQLRHITLIMRIHIGVILVLLSFAGVIYHLTSQGGNYNGYPYLYTCQTGKTPGRFTYGWPVNKTLMLMDDYAAFKVTDTAGSNFMCYDLWQTIPKHELTIIDSNLLVAYATDGVQFTHFLIINGTKWPFLGGANQTTSYGIPSSKIVQTNMAFLNNYPTTYYIPMSS